MCHLILLSPQPHIAVDNLDQIHDENGNNLLHIAASYGHAECLQHLTSLMGEDCLSERNEEKLTPAGLAIKVIDMSNTQLTLSASKPNKSTDVVQHKAEMNNFQPKADRAHWVITV